MSRQSKVSALDFVKVFAPMAKQGKSALEIGRVLGFEGTDDKITLAVSARASQLRTKFKEAAVTQARVNGLDQAATDALVAQMAGMLPRIHAAGRKTDVSELVAAISGALASMDAPETPPEVPAVEVETIPAVEVEPEVVPVVELEVVEDAPKSRKRGKD